MGLALDNLEAYWPFTGGSLVDVANGLTLTAHGSPTPAAGFADAGYTLNNGTPDWFTMASNAHVGFGNERFTIACAVFSPATIGGPAGLVTKETSAVGAANIEYGLFFDSATNHFGARLSNGTTLTTLVSGVGYSPSSTWIPVRMFYDLANLNLQVSTGTISQSANTTGCANAGKAFQIGAQAAAGNAALPGTISAVAIWRRLLSTQEWADYCGGLKYPLGYKNWQRLNRGLNRGLARGN